MQASGTSPLATALTGAGRAAADVPSAVTAARRVPGTPGRTDPAPPGLEPRRLQPKGGAAPGPVRRHCPGSTRRAPEPLCKAAGRGLRYPRQRRGDAGQAGQQRLARRSERRPARGSSSVPRSLRPSLPPRPPPPAPGRPGGVVGGAPRPAPTYRPPCPAPLSRAPRAAAAAPAPWGAPSPAAAPRLRRRRGAAPGRAEERALPRRGAAERPPRRCPGTRVWSGAAAG